MRSEHRLYLGRDFLRVQRAPNIRIIVTQNLRRWSQSFFQCNNQIYVKDEFGGMKCMCRNKNVRREDVRLVDGDARGSAFEFVENSVEKDSVEELLSVLVERLISTNL